MKWLRRVVILIAALTAASLGPLVSLAAADTIVQSFQADSSVQPGWVVAVKPGSSGAVELAPAEQSQLIYGVAVDPTQAPVTLQRKPSQQIYIATSGNYPVFVSTQGGSINTGDYLSISSTDGVASKATGQQSFVLGQALEKFDGTSGVLSGSGRSAIGKVNVAILVQRNPLAKDNIALPSFLRSAGDSIAGKELTPVRIYSALAAFMVAAIIAFGTLTVGVRSAMTAIGRNPLSRHSILNGLIEVVMVSLAVLILGLFSVYLLLKI